MPFLLLSHQGQLVNYLSTQSLLLHHLCLFVSLIFPPPLIYLADFCQTEVAPLGSLINFKSPKYPYVLSEVNFKQKPHFKTFVSQVFMIDPIKRQV